MRARVRIDTLAKNNFIVRIEAHHTSVIAQDWSYSISEAIARTAAAFSENEEHFIRCIVDYLQDNGLKELRKQISDVKALAESEIYDLSHEIYAEPFTRTIKLFARALLEEEGDTGLLGRVRHLEDALESLRSFFQAGDSPVLSCETLKAYSDMLDLEQSVRAELHRLEDGITSAPLDVAAGVTPQIMKHSRWATSPAYSEPPPGLLEVLRKKIA